jgi:hypothetical protein
MAARSADGATTATTIAPTVLESRGKSASVTAGRWRCEQPFALNVSGHAAYVFEQPIETGTGHSDEPAEVLRR